MKQSRSIEIVSGLTISKTMWGRMVREWHAEYQDRLHGRDQEWEAYLNDIGAGVLARYQEEGLQAPWLVQRRLEQITEFFRALAVRFG